MIPDRYKGFSLTDYEALTDKQKEVLAVCKEFIDGRYESGIILTGKNGTGKTMLCCLILKQMIKRNPNENRGHESDWYLYTEAIKIVRGIKDTWGKEATEQAAIDKYVRPKVTQMMVDDGEITEDIQELFLKMIKDSCDISITLDEVKNEIEEMIIGEHKNPHLFDTLYLKF